ncbi:MAG: DUF4167 domain-containing protein [Sneathiella sp.]|uniref:DUF4167 domain-containing protein n=1 Tax=Sneathiella sp. TaxID=1964365 RepID=UPI0030031A3D
MSSNRRPRGGRTNTGSSNRSGGNSNRSNNNNNNNRRAPNGNRNYDSNGPDGKIRGTALQVYDKYIAVATDAQTAGDRVAAENYFQHAEHYFRIVAANNAAKQEKMSEQQAQSNGQDSDNNENSKRQGNSGQPDTRNNSAETESEITDKAVETIDLSTTEQPAIDLAIDVETEVIASSEDVSSEDVAAGDDEEETPKRKTSRTRTLRRRTSSRATQKDDSEQIDPVD